MDTTLMDLNHNESQNSIMINKFDGRSFISQNNTTSNSFLYNKKLIIKNVQAEYKKDDSLQ